MHDKVESGTSTSIWGAFALMLMLVLFGGMILYGNGVQLLDSNKAVMHTYEVVGQLEAIRSSITTAESAARGYVLLHDKAFVEQYEASSGSIGKELNNIQNLTTDNPVQLEHLKALRPLIARKLRILKTGIASHAADQGLLADSGSPGPQVMVRINSTLDAMESEENTLLEGRQTSNTHNWNRATAAFWGGICVQILALVALLVLALRVIRVQSRARVAEANHRSDLERQVELRTAELRSSNEDLESFSAAVSHDLQAPLRHIDAIASMLKEDAQAKLTGEQDADVGRIRKEIRRMNQIIEDLLRLSRTARGDVQAAQADMSALASESWHDVHDRNGNGNISLRVEPGVQAEADPNMVRILLDNLLANALKYSSKTEAAHVEFGATVLEGVPTYFVKDNGVGFNPAYAGKLFQPFTRLHSEREFEGSGLGLAICKRIVTRHGGRIWAESKLGEGATFFFTLHPSVSSSEGQSAAGTLLGKRH
jgi:Bacteriophytochrome (light-regulated signal transduction histidine kinase)